VFVQQIPTSEFPTSVRKRRVQWRSRMDDAFEKYEIQEKKSDGRSNTRLYDLSR
jgi:hypothetical protein